MNSRDRERVVLWDQVAMALIAVIVIVGTVWWLQVNFDAVVALLVVGLGLGVGIFMYGSITGRRDAIRTAQITMDGVGDMFHAVSGALTANSKASQEYAKSNTYLLRQEEAVAKHVNRLAEQRASALIDVQKASENVWGSQRQPAEQPAGGWVEYQ